MNEPTLKLGKDCKHCLPDAGNENHYTYARCGKTRTEEVNPVDGSVTVDICHCSVERNDHGTATGCGPTGRYFEPLSPVSPKLLATPETGLSGSATAGDSLAKQI